MSLKQKISIEFPILDGKPDETKAEASEASNGKPNKKIMSELTSIDPLDYFSRFLDIPEMIFQHLSGKESLVASEVSPSWYNFIASSKVLMKKVKVAFYFERTLEDYNLVKNSSRQYQNIRIRRCYMMKNSNNSKLDIFYCKAHEWKNVSFESINEDFRTKLDLWKLLSSIESSVESFYFYHCGDFLFKDSTSEIESFDALKFPKLKKFKFRHYAVNVGDILGRFFSNSVAIEELDLYDGQVDKDILTKMLENFDKLTSLSIHSTIINQIFEDESWKKFQFKLKTLKIKIPAYRSLGTNFRNFLKSQSDYLEELKINANVRDGEIFDVIMEMPKLTNFTFSLKYFGTFSDNEIPTKMSTTITELNLPFNIEAVSLKFLLDSMPKVRSLQLNIFDEEIFKMLKSMNRKFEKLRVLTLKGVDRKEVEEIMTENYTLLESYYLKTF